jgi:hypothetical protein
MTFIDVLFILAVVLISIIISIIIYVEGGRMMSKPRVSDHFWAFLMGILVGVPTGVFGGVLLVEWMRS